MKKTVIALCLALSLASCVTYRPQYDDDYEKAMSTVIGQNEQIKFEGYCYWHPNTSVLRTNYYLTGNLVVTDKGIYFLEWNEDENLYKVTKKIYLSNIKNVKYMSHSLNNGISIEQKNEKYDMFSYGSPVGIAESSKNQLAADYIKSKINDTANK